MLELLVRPALSNFAPAGGFERSNDFATIRVYIYTHDWWGASWEADGRTTRSPRHSQPLGFLVGCRVPTILRIGNLRVVIYSNDHRPAHVHVLGPGCEAVFNLGCPEGPPILRESLGFSTAELNRLRTTLAAELAILCAEWERIHGYH